MELRCCVGECTSRPGLNTKRSSRRDHRKMIRSRRRPPSNPTSVSDDPACVARCLAELLCCQDGKDRNRDNNGGRSHSRRRRDDDDNGYRDRDRRDDDRDRGRERDDERRSRRRHSGTMLVACLELQEARGERPAIMNL